MLFPVSSAADPRVADYRAIPDPELVRARGLFVAEGRLVVARLLAQDRFPVRSVLVNAAALEGLREAVEARPGLPVFVAEADTLSAIGGFNFHRGCLAIGERLALPPADALLVSAAPRRPLVILEGVTQADNVGSVFRNAQAFGAAAVLLDPATCDPLYRKALRTSMGNVLHVPYSRLEHWPGALALVRAAGFRIVALTPRPPATPLDAFLDASGSAPLALLVGAEGAGLRRETLEKADDRVFIPMAPGADSVNLATATGIALHAIHARTGFTTRG